jgi:hypothetical protein
MICVTKTKLAFRSSVTVAAIRRDGALSLAVETELEVKAPYLAVAAVIL